MNKKMSRKISINLIGVYYPWGSLQIKACQRLFPNIRELLIFGNLDHNSLLVISNSENLQIHLQTLSLIDISNLYGRIKFDKISKLRNLKCLEI